MAARALATAVAVAFAPTTSRSQSALMVGGRPPKDVEMELCDIGTVFAKLNEIKSNPDCHSQPAPPTWYPGRADTCNAACGIVFEPFWDQCGEMLTVAGMGGMDEMGIFYDHCLEALYPPGSCGTFCNLHTYECYLTEIQESCCDEEGHNCEAGHDVPNTCQVGCAIVFPQFVETCRDHIRDQPELNEPEFEQFEETCLEQDGLALVEYALDLQNSGCHVELGNFRRQMQADLRDRYFLGQWIGPSAPLCSWDEIDDWARDTDTICCGNQMHHCHADSYGVSPPEECTPACAVALHTFTTACAEVLTQIIGDRAASINDFHMQCLNAADPHFFLNAIMHADCSGATGVVAPPPPPEATTATTSVEVYSTDGIEGQTTQRLIFTLPPTAVNVYAMAGDDKHPMMFPAAYQVPSPFGVDFGGVDPALSAIRSEAEFDSYLTLGITDGSAPGAMAASPGLGLEAWTEDAGFSTSNGALFYMDPAAGPTDPTVVVAQITRRTGSSGTATAKLQGRETGDAKGRWVSIATWNW